MERFERAFEWVRTITVGILVVGFGSIEEAVAQSKSHYDSWTYLLAFVVASVLFKVVEKSAELSVENSLYLRRWIAGRHFIEGHWKEIVRDEDTGKVYCSTAFIYYEDGKLKVSGRDFDADGAPLGTSRAIASEYDDGELRFIFESERELGQSADGVSTYVFGMNESIPSSFHGEILDSVSKMKSKVTGERVVDSHEVGEFSTPGGNVGFILQTFLESRWPGFPADDTHRSANREK